MRRESGAAPIAALWFAALAIAAVGCGPSRASDHATLRGTPQQRPRHVVTAILVGETRVRLDSTADFAAVERVLGSATTAEPLDHDDSWKICYHLPNSRDAKYVIFMANEVGGANHRVIGVRVLSNEPSRSTVQCSPTTARVDDVVADNGVHLGMSRDSIESIVGGTPARTETSDDWEYHDIVTVTPRDSAQHVGPVQHETISSCIVTFLDGRSTDIQWWYAAIS